MTADKPSQLVPKLRFPEFRDLGEWYKRPLGELAYIIAGQSPSGENYNTTGNGVPFYQGKADFGDTYLKKPTKWTTQVTKLARPNDILMSVRAPVGALNVSTEQICIGRGLACLQPRCDRWFLYYALLGQSGRIIGNGGSVFDSINKDQIEKLPIPASSNVAEQQKIADCLGSLDKLIIAENRKLEVLRQHKQGLMQQLFPQPGETVPRLRFPEFRGAGDWITKILDSQGGFLSSLTGKTAKDFDTGNAAFIPYMNVFSNTFTNVFDLRSVNVGSNESQNAVAKGDVFFTISSETQEEAGMSSVLLEEIENCYLNSFCALFRFDTGKSPNPVFLGYLLRSALARAHLSREAQGATRYNISKATFHSLPLQLPSRPEQQQIADCLGSLDDLIAAEARKLEALRKHKQGLMQQLFPNLEDR